MVDTVNRNLLTTRHHPKERPPVDSACFSEFISIKDRPRARRYPKIDVFRGELAIYGRAPIYTNVYTYAYTRYPWRQNYWRDDNVNGVQRLYIRMADLTPPDTTVNWKCQPQRLQLRFLSVDKGICELSKLCDSWYITRGIIYARALYVFNK